MIDQREYTNRPTQKLVVQKGQPRGPLLVNPQTGCPRQTTGSEQRCPTKETVKTATETERTARSPFWRKKSLHLEEESKMTGNRPEQILQAVKARGYGLGISRIVKYMQVNRITKPFCWINKETQEKVCRAKCGYKTELNTLL